MEIKNDDKFILRVHICWSILSLDYLKILHKTIVSSYVDVLTY